MTVIVAIGDGRRVIMGGDSAATDPHSLDKWKLGQSKVVSIGDFVYGIAGDPMLLQSIKHNMKPPAHKSESDLDYISGVFLDTLRKAFKSDKEFNGQLLVGYRGRVYEIMHNYLVIRNAQNYAAIGSGAVFAKGALATTTGVSRRRLKLALEAAVEHNAGCAAPFTFVEGAYR